MSLINYHSNYKSFSHYFLQLYGMLLMASNIKEFKA
nr:MAG TPA: hypothetical protein [Caudoviricetes sp.]